MFINNKRSNGNPIFTSTIIKYDDSMSSITLNGTIQPTTNENEKPKDVLILAKNGSMETDPLNEYKISDWIKYCIVEGNDNESKYLSLYDNHKKITDTNGAIKKIIYLRANDGLIEYNKFGNVILKGFGTFNCLNKILYLQNGFLIKIMPNENNVRDNDKIKSILIIKHLYYYKNIIIKDNEKIFISDKIYLMKDSSTFLEDNEDFTKDNDILIPPDDSSNSILNIPLKKENHQMMTIFKIDDNDDSLNGYRLITFNFLTGNILYYINENKIEKGYFKITSLNKFDYIPPPIK